MFSSLNNVISTNESNWISTGHVTFELCYNQIYQLKTTLKCPTLTSNLKQTLLCIYDVMWGFFSVGRMLIIQRCQSSQRFTKMTAKGAFLLTFAATVASLPDRSTVQFKLLVFSNFFLKICLISVEWLISARILFFQNKYWIFAFW